MPVISATETKNKFGQVLLQAAKEPITIEKSGSPVAVIMSYDAYEHYQLLEDRYWGERAVSARERGGYVGGMAVLDKIQKRIDEE
ncbi:MAG: type II toxin-antitoxin system prevent-host-death family antitoxin [Synergistaceae bacterium]|nr:type II toxin-antitoxin system prevent-host-death family antitoxin [Synergistaceae bacterium]